MFNRFGSLTLLVRTSLLAAALLVQVRPANSESGCVACCRPNIEGKWSGHWESCTTGHEGKLCGKIVAMNACQYECRFSGTFFKIIPFTYKVPLDVTRVEGGVIYFQANKALPLFGGEFKCCGYATCKQFHARYQSSDDHGIFVMSR